MGFKYNKTLQDRNLWRVNAPRIRSSIDRFTPQQFVKVNWITGIYDGERHHVRPLSQNIDERSIDGDFFFVWSSNNGSRRSRHFCNNKHTVRCVNDDTRSADSYLPCPHSFSCTSNCVHPLSADNARADNGNQLKRGKSVWRNNHIAKNGMRRDGRFLFLPLQRGYFRYNTANNCRIQMYGIRGGLDDGHTRKCAIF